MSARNLEILWENRAISVEFQKNVTKIRRKFNIKRQRRLDLFGQKPINTLNTIDGKKRIRHQLLLTYAHTCTRRPRKFVKLNLNASFFFWRYRSVRARWFSRTFSAAIGHGVEHQRSRGELARHWLCVCDWRVQMRLTCVDWKQMK